MEDQLLLQLVQEKKWSEILQGDQLREDIKTEKSFSGFQEAEIDFPPSFKYVHASTTLDTRRPPAYTDRILWTTPTAYSSHQVECTSYSSHEIFWSDHRPVHGAYVINMRVVDEDKRHAILQIAQRELDKLEEVYRPSLEVQTTNVDFGEIL